MAPDPILAAIEVHRAALAAFEAFGKSPPLPVGEDDAMMAALSEVADTAARAMLDVEPSTMAGLVALLDLAKAVDGETWPQRLDETSGAVVVFETDLLCLVAKAARRLSGLGGEPREFTK